MKTILLLSTALAFTACEQRIETPSSQPAEKTEEKSTTIVQPPVSEKKSETNTTIVNPPKTEEKSSTTTTTTGQ